MPKFYYLKHKAGGHMELRKSGKGYTWSEPTDKGLPRLFTTEKGAKMARSWWAKGPLLASNTKPYYTPANSKVKASLKQTRDPYDWEIKEIHV